MSRRREERKYFFMAMIFLSIPFINGGDCGPKFNDKCSCGMSKYNDRIQYVVNCTNNGFREVSMLQHLPLQTENFI
ncbi:CLUMA_CG011493, isoform A [Clunio marinus]|uniref:CLUMA_CG011493, isoform A n=1 Tax=Clunio marinus TaxID=568069 RepID=A0A1J1ICW8_9DIPT|nr:CLUMA_CG011493, isoform A [Clunio marinus]